MKLFRLTIFLATLLSTVGVLPVKAQSIDPCTAYKIVKEVEDYLLFIHSPQGLGFGLEPAVELAGDGKLWIAAENVQFDIKFGNMIYQEEHGGRALSRYFVGKTGRDEFIALLNAAGYEHPTTIWRTTPFFGDRQDLYQKKANWKDPCSGRGGSGGAMVPETTVHYAWYIWVLFILALIAAGIIIRRVLPI